MAARRGDTLLFERMPVIASHAAVGGKKEGEGPLAAEFDELFPDNNCGQANWETAEKILQLRAARLCLKKAHATEKQVSLVLAGDLQAQCTASSYALRELHLPFVGLFGACSTMAEALGLGAALCSLLHPAGQGVGIAAATFGRVEDYQIKDINNMGAAMAPAAAATLLRYLHDTGQEPKDFDAIYTGDLGHLGSRLFREILTAEGLVMKNHIDCGSILYDAARQNVKSGGSGPGCCAAVLCGHILPRLERGSYRRVLFIATGALMSQTTFLQKESIPAIAHLVELRGPECTARG